MKISSCCCFHISSSSAVWYSAIDLGSLFSGPLLLCPLFPKSSLLGFLGLSTLENDWEKGGLNNIRMSFNCWEISISKMALEHKDRVLKAHSHSMSGDSIRAFLDCPCVSWIAEGLVMYLSMDYLPSSFSKTAMAVKGNSDWTSTH